MTKEDVPIERLINLTFALLDAERAGRQFLTGQWLRTHVKGYRDKTGGTESAAAHRKLKRDIALLIRAGVPIESVAGRQGPGYRLQAEDYPLPEVQFTPEEAAMLGLAGEIGQTGELAAFTRSGWTKLAASGATRDLAATPVFNAVNDLARLDPAQLDLLLKACREDRRISFSYRPDRVSEPMTRTMDPWGIVNHRDLLYLVGHDIDRDAPRSFRIFRVADIEVIGQASHRHGDDDLQQLVETSLRRQKTLVDAVVWVDPGHALELVDRAEALGEERWRLVDADADWLVRTAAGYAPAVVLEKPVELREQIRALIAQAGDI
ncbi:helix-turn-helix transcriptional regulator [Corynebacterium halotolerans]|uniref:helix-turn-helix transcriptional regulator n=1 Tax=Corynebacterium halotolerans TaxID=225326 RepID=UPI003CF49E79